MVKRDHKGKGFGSEGKGDGSITPVIHERTPEDELQLVASILRHPTSRAFVTSRMVAPSPPLHESDQSDKIAPDDNN